MSVATGLVAGLGVLIVFSFSPNVVGAGDDAEAQFRVKHSLEPAVVLKFLDEKRTEITLAEFLKKTDAGTAFGKMKSAGQQGEDIRTFLLLAPTTDEQLAKAKEAEKARQAKMQQLIGKPLAAFSLPDVEGRQVSNKDLLGRPTLINFFFAECLPCIVETPMLNEYLGHRKDLRMLAVTFDGKAAIEKYIRKHKFAWQSLVGAKPWIDQIGIRAYPSYLIADEEGVIRGIASLSDFPRTANESERDSIRRNWLDEWVNRSLAAK